MKLSIQQKYMIGGGILVALIGYAWWSHHKTSAVLATSLGPSPLPAGTTPPAGTVPGAGPGAPPGMVPGAPPTTPGTLPLSTQQRPVTMTYVTPMATQPPMPFVGPA